MIPPPNKRIVLTACAASFLLSVTNAQIAKESTTNMFRATASHNITLTGPADLYFEKAAWKFAAKAPIRSTPVCDATTIYFGASNGIVYALNKKTGAVKWASDAGAAVNSSPAIHGNKLFFTDNRQRLYCLNASSGKPVWTYSFDKSLDYPWAFDYFYSSPTLFNNNIFVGGKDGYLHCVSEEGKPIWKTKTKGIVRSTPAVKGNKVYVGDTEGFLYAFDNRNGELLWTFSTTGAGLKNEDFGFDRKAIIASPVVAGNKVIVGGRDGFLYAVDGENGKEIWRMNHEVSWVISTVAVNDSIVVTGTSDGRFVQGIQLDSGKERWRFKTASIVWSSPVIYNETVYIGSNEGTVYGIGLREGRKQCSFHVGGAIFSSPVISDTLLYIGGDNSFLQAVGSSHLSSPASLIKNRFVFYEAGVNLYFKYGTDRKIRDYLTENGYKTLDSTRLIDFFQHPDSAVGSVVVFATNYFPAAIKSSAQSSLLRNYLANGGRVVVLGHNPLVYETDSLTRLIGFDFSLPEKILGISYGPNDLRSMSGVQPAFPTEAGKAAGLPPFWTGFLPLSETQAGIVLGKDENGKASAWVKKFNAAGTSGFVQVWLSADGLFDLDMLTRIAEHSF